MPKVDPTNITPEVSLSLYRFYCDFRSLNSQTAEFGYNIPDLHDLAKSCTEKTSNFMSSLDLSSGFFQMDIHPDLTKCTAFNNCYGMFKFLRLSIGLRSSPNLFLLLMDKVLLGLTFKSLLCYLDDICIISETIEQHLSDFHEVLNMSKSSGLKLRPTKCKFAHQNVFS